MTTTKTQAAPDIGKLAIGTMMSGVNSAVEMVTSVSSTIMGIANNIGSGIMAMQDQASGLTDCYSYVAQTQEQIAQAKNMSAQLTVKTQEQVANLNKEMDQQQEIIRVQLPLLQQHNQSLQQQIAQYQQIEGDLLQKTQVLKDYQNKLQIYKTELQKYKEQYQQCIDRGLTKTTEIVLQLVLFIVSASVSFLVTRAITNKGKQADKDAANKIKFEKPKQ